MDTTGSNSQSIITADAEVTGNIKTNGSLQIDGKVEGDVACGHDVAVGKTGSVKGNTTVNSIVVEGTIEGNITARERIELKSSTRMVGDLKAKRLAIEEGVAFSGKAEITPSATGETGAAKAENRSAASSAAAASVAARPDPRGNLFGKR
ncbi:MAG: polymer-forming cytoskeletal protein [Verrucomicrobia bacterium]|nr:polymer-forming cytoskeletal protein [Verrucomicrobiota bacterium]